MLNSGATEHIVGLIFTIIAVLIFTEKLTKLNRKTENEKPALNHSTIARDVFKMPCDPPVAVLTLHERITSTFTMLYARTA